MNIDKLLAIMARLRHLEHGCPWDLQQDHRSILRYTIEEVYEVEDAIMRDDSHALMDELGDLLFHVVFHARIAEEAGRFNFADVVSAIVTKMIRRHPHVFADRKVSSMRELSAAWERTKAAESVARGNPQPDSLLDGVPANLPVLLKALKLQQRAAAAGFDWPDIAAACGKLDEEVDELKQAIAHKEGAPRVLEEIGDVLFVAVNLARHAGADPNQVLDSANRKFDARFRRMEALAGRGQPLAERSQAQLEALWNRVKKEEQAAGEQC